MAASQRIAEPSEMPDDESNKDSQTTPAPPTPTGPSEPAAPAIVDVRETPEFKAALDAALRERLPKEAERVFSERLPRERSKIRKQLKQEFQASMSTEDDEPAPSAPAAESGGELAEVRAQLNALTTELALSRTFNDFPGFSHEQRDWIMKNMPQGANAHEYCEQVAKVMGIGKQEPATQPPTDTTQQPSPGVTLPPQAAVPTGRPASDLGGPSNGSETFNRSDPTRWNDNDIQRLVAEAKEQKLHPARYVKENFLAALRGHRVTVNGGGRPK